MKSVAATDPRVRHLLDYLAQDAGNLQLRSDAIAAACASGEWDVAGTLLEAGFTLYPDHPQLLAHLGLVHLQAQRYTQAETALFAALLQGLEAQPVRYNLAFAYVMQHRHTQALELLDQQLLQSVPQALLLRARCLHHLRRPEAALADCHGHLALVPGDAQTHGLIALLLTELDREGEVQVHVDAALSADPHQLEALLARAGLQQGLQDYDAAALTFELVVAAHPHSGRGWLGLALIHLMHLRLAPAKQSAELAVQHLPDHIGSWHVLAWTHLLLNEVDAAELALARAMSLDRNFAETHGGLAVVAALQGREDAARMSIKRAQRLDAESKSAQYARMLLLQRAGEHAAARAVMDELQAQPAGPGDRSIRNLVHSHIDYLNRRAGEPLHGVVH